MGYVSTYQLEVRSYELDVYNHVNNAVYVEWLEHGRCRLLQDKGYDYMKVIRDWNVHFMTLRTDITYKQAFKIGDHGTVSTQVEKIGNTSVTIAHAITRNDDAEPSIVATVTIVFTDADTGKPTPVPDEFKRLYA